MAIKISSYILFQVTLPNTNILTILIFEFQLKNLFGYIIFSNLSK